MTNKLYRRLAAVMAAIVLVSGFASLAAAADTSDTRLVVVISIDQLRADYLSRFDRYFEDGGFRRLTRRGAFFANAYVSHGGSETAPGHATISTGRIPRQHGIVGNKWFLKPGVTKAQQPVDDPEARLVGAESSAAGAQSPRMLIGAAIGDELKLADRRSRVFSVALKDRAAIFMAGRNPDGVFWCDKPSGLMVTSTYYTNQLPAYVAKFNETGGTRLYAGKTWEPLLAPETYAGTYPIGDDWSKIGESLGAKFPHRIPDAPKKPDAEFSEAVWGTPYGNDIVLTVARDIVENEKLGVGAAPDMLFIGLSANDHVGHLFGPESPEVMDMTIRTDRQLAAFFDALDKSVGLNKCLLVVTADHGMSTAPKLAQGRKLDAGLIDIDQLRSGLTKALRDSLPKDAPAGPLVLGINVPWIYCDPQFAELDSQSAGRLSAIAVDYLRRQPGIEDVYTAAELAGPAPSRDDRERWLAWRSYNPQRAGRFYLKVTPYWLKSDDEDIAGHDSGFLSSRHIPIAFAGPGIVPGRRLTLADQTDIAVTIAAILGIEAPSEAVGRVLHEAFEPAPAK